MCSVRKIPTEFKSTRRSLHILIQEKHYKTRQFLTTLAISVGRLVTNLVVSFCCGVKTPRETSESFSNTMNKSGEEFALELQNGLRLAGKKWGPEENYKVRTDYLESVTARNEYLHFTVGSTTQQLGMGLPRFLQVRGFTWFALILQDTEDQTTPTITA